MKPIYTIYDGENDNPTDTPSLLETLPPRESLFTTRRKQNEKDYRSGRLLFQIGIFLVLVYNNLKVGGLYYYHDTLVLFLCNDMKKVIKLEEIDMYITIGLCLLGFYASIIRNIRLYDGYLIILIADLFYKIVIFSYFLSFNSAYVTICLNLRKQLVYVIMVIDTLGFLFCIYEGNVLRGYLTRIDGFKLAKQQPLILSSDIELQNH